MQIYALVHYRKDRQTETTFWISTKELERLRKEMFAVPTSFPKDKVTKAPTGIREAPLDSYPEF